MVANTSIEWAHHTFNPWIGCQHVSPACDHCYAEQLSRMRLGVEWGPGAERRRTKPGTWAQPRRWNREAERLGVRYRVFCASLADVFDNAVNPLWRTDLAELIEATPNLDWLLLTKRIGNAEPMMRRHMLWTALPPNVWIGATIVSQEEADRDVPKLLTTPASRRFVSMEPLLGPVDLTRCRVGTGTGEGEWAGRTIHLNLDALRGAPSIKLPALDWVIVGGESGPGARPMHPDWARSLRDQCAAAGVPFLFKQWGEFALEGLSSEKWILRADGSHDPMPTPNGIGHHRPRGGSSFVYRVGKKRAGRLLDRVQHDGLPR